MTEPRLPSDNAGHCHRRRLQWRFAMVSLVVLLIANVMAAWIWYDIYRGFMLFLPLVFESLFWWYLTLPIPVFGSMAAIIFAVGCYLRWPPPLRRIGPAWRGLTLVLAVVVLHGIWFDHAWVPFRPLCLEGGAMWTPNRFYGLDGPLTPEATRIFNDMLQSWWGEDAARLAGPNAIEVRPAIALFDNELNWNMTTQVAKHLAEAQGLEPFERPDLDRCEEVERIVMAGGHAAQRLDGWGTWPWNTIDGNSRFVWNLQRK